MVQISHYMDMYQITTCQIFGGLSKIIHNSEKKILKCFHFLTALIYTDIFNLYNSIKTINNRMNAKVGENSAHNVHFNIYKTMKQNSNVLF